MYKSRVDNIKEEIAANRKSAEMVKQNIDAVAKRLLNSKTIVDKQSYKTGGVFGLWRKTKVRDVEKSIAELLGLGNFEKKLRFKLGKIKIFETSFNPQKNIEITDELLNKLEQINAAKPFYLLFSILLTYTTISFNFFFRNNLRTNSWNTFIHI
ncbi:hypothetical protein, partial [Ornithobacterium rhinotracheale]